MNPVKLWSTERLFSRGQRLARQGRLQEAVAAYDEALRLDGAYGRIHLQRGLALSAGGHYSSAAGALKRAVELEPRNAVFRFYQGLVYYDAGRDAEALAAAEEGCRLDARNAFGAGLMALLLIRQGRVADACDLVLDSAGPVSAPVEARLLTAAASRLFGAQRTDDYLSTARPGLVMSAAWCAVLRAEVLLLAESLSLLERAEQADDAPTAAEKAHPNTSIYTLSLRALPTLLDWRLALADTYFKGQHAESPLEASPEGHRWFRKRKEPHLPAAPDYLCFKAIILLSLGEYEHGQQVLREAMDQNPDSASPHFLLALSSIMLGQEIEAGREFEYFAHRPHGPALANVLRALRAS